MKRIVLPALLGLLVVFAFAGSAMAQSAATLTTDKLDYMPGEVAVISGAGFQGGELIDLSIAIQDPDSGEWVADWDWAEGYCGEDGTFTAEYLVPDRALAKSLRATAMGLSSALVATVEFTDAAAANVYFATVGLPAGTSVSVTWNGTNNGGNPISGSTAFSSPGPSASTGTGQGTTFTYSFPSSITVGADTYDLMSSAPASGFTMPVSAPPVPPTTVTATYQKYEPPVPQVVPNTAPTITADDLDLGSLVGCLTGTSFGKTIPISVDDFTYTVDDAEGDPVTVTLSVDSITLAGPGAASATVTLTATDDPSARNAEHPTWTPAEPLSTSVDVEVTAQIVYDFVGFLSPLSPEGTWASKIVKQGSTVPAKFQLFDCCGHEITNLNLPTNTTDEDWQGQSQLPQLFVCLQQGTAPDGDPSITDSGSSNDNTWRFRYSAPSWIYNVQTKPNLALGLPYAAGSTYQIWVYLNDGTWHYAPISIK